MVTASRWLVRGIAIAIVIACLVWLVRDIDLAAVAHVLAHAHLVPIVLAAALNFGVLASKALTWRVLLGPDHRVSVARLTSYTITASAGSVLMPLRAGEVLRVWLLRDRDGVPVARSIAVALAEKLLDIVSMLLLVAPLPWLVEALPPSFVWWVPGLAIAVIALLVILWLVAPRLRSTRFGGFVEALAIVHRPRVFVSGVSFLLAGWLVDVAMVLLAAAAVGVDLSIGDGILVLFAINLAIAFPSTPGQLGAFEVGAMIGLRFLGIDDHAGLAFALAYHVLQIVPVTVAGLVLNARLLTSHAPVRS